MSSMHGGKVEFDGSVDSIEIPKVFLLTSLNNVMLSLIRADLITVYDPPNANVDPDTVNPTNTNVNVWWEKTGYNPVSDLYENLTIHASAKFIGTVFYRFI